ncbi:MAG: 23S rRNA (guanosine(2251)-2'-O)-methyltransferase RlmB [Acidimicrobiales bacterium]|nr:23S rRNA (guanosine(2251)-2'-O)-methyltransferase RlmB [Acidimicrobiales bacterium]
MSPTKRATKGNKRGARGSGREAGRRSDRGLGGEQVEGRQAVRELLIAGRRRVREVWIAEEHDDHGVLADIAELAAGAGVPVREVSRKKLLGEARTDAPQGVLAKAAPLAGVGLEELLVGPAGAGSPRSRPGSADTRSAAPFLLAVDGVTDPGNLGALLRTAECAGVTGVILPRHRAVHVTPAVTKSAAGAVEYLRMAVVGGLPAALNTLRANGVWVVGLDMAGEELFALDLDATEPLCLVFGAEGRGLGRLVRQRCDVLASIPLYGQLASLNVAAAGAVACYEIVRRRDRNH